MEILKITKVGLFYKVKLDNETTYKFHESVIIKYALLRKGINVTEEKLQEVIKDNEYYLALDKAINYLKVPKSKYDTYIYLKKYYDNELCNAVLNKLLELKLLNDLEYAKNYVFIAKKKHYGSIKIIEELKLSKVCEEDIFNALEDYSLSEEIENCNITFDKYLTSLKKCSSALAKKKMVNHLISKGFSNDSITNVVEKKQKMLDNISDEDKLLAVAFEKLKKAKKTNDEREFKQKAIRSLTAKGFPLSKVLKIVEGRK